MVFLYKVENFVLWEAILFLFGSVVTLMIGVYYLYRYKKNKSLLTLQWGLGFSILGFGLLINTIFVDFFEVFGHEVEDRRILFQDLFARTGLLIFLTFLAWSIFSLQFFSKEIENISSKIVLSIGSVCITYHVIVTLFSSEIFNLGLIVLVLYSLFILGFFFYFAYKTKDWRITLISIGMLGSAIVRIRHISSISETVLALIILFLVNMSYLLIGIGLLYPKKEQR